MCSVLRCGQVIDNRAEAHLGWIHTAEDGNNYFCINAASLYFVPDGVDIPTEVHALVCEGIHH